MIQRARSLAVRPPKSPPRGDEGAACQPGPYRVSREDERAEQSAAGDALQRPLVPRSRFRQWLSCCVLAPRKAWRLVPGARPGRVRARHPPVSRLASRAESWGRTRRTRGAKRRQRLLSAVGVPAPPAVLVPASRSAGGGRRGWSRAPKATPAQPSWRGWEGPPESTGRGRPEERRRSTGEAPKAPAGGQGGSRVNSA